MPIPLHLRVSTGEVLMMVEAEDDRLYDDDSLAAKAAEEALAEVGWPFRVVSVTKGAGEVILVTIEGLG